MAEVACFFFIFCQAYRSAGEATVATLEVPSFFLSLRELSHLPGVDAAVTSGEGVALGILQSVQDGFVFGAEVKPEKSNKITNKHKFVRVNTVGGIGKFYFASYRTDMCLRKHFVELIIGLCGFVTATARYTGYRGNS